MSLPDTPLPSFINIFFLPIDFGLGLGLVIIGLGLGIGVVVFFLGLDPATPKALSAGFGVFLKPCAVCEDLLLIPLIVLPLPFFFGTILYWPPLCGCVLAVPVVAAPTSFAVFFIEGVAGIKTVWKFSVGDLVSHDERGTGIVENRRVQSFHVMDRPVRIIEKQMYDVLLSSSSSFVVFEGDSLSLVQKEGTVESR